MSRLIGLIVLGVLIFSVISAYLRRKPTPADDTNQSEYERFLTGTATPPIVPAGWSDEPLPEGAGWRWFNPENRGDCVRMYRGDPTSSDASMRKPYVIVTRNGQVIGQDGEPTGKTLDD